MKFLKLISTLPLLMLLSKSEAQELRASQGIYITLDGQAQMVMNGMGLNNSGNFKANNGTLVFTGAATDGAALINGSSMPTLHHLKIDRSSGDLLLNTGIFVTGSLELVTGNLDLNNYSVDLGTTGFIVGESRAARIIGRHGGYVKSIATMNAPQHANPGNLGLDITSDANMGTTTIIRGHLQQLNKNGELSIQRYYEINPAFPIHSEVKVHAGFLDIELADKEPAELVLWSSNDAGRNWKAVKTNARNYELTTETGMNSFRLTYFSRQSGAAQMNNAFIQLYPNPVRDRFTLSYYSSQEEDIVVNLYGKNGQLMEAKRIRAVPGLNKIEWSVAKYAAGTYQLRMIGGNGKNLAFVKE